jgi:hypothetical protein
MPTETKMRIRNAKNAVLVVVVEPWGSRFELDPGKDLNVTFSAPGGGVVECEIGDGTTTIFGWEGSVFSSD